MTTTDRGDWWGAGDRTVPTEATAEIYFDPAMVPAVADVLRGVSYYAATPHGREHIVCAAPTEALFIKGIEELIRNAIDRHGRYMTPVWHEYISDVVAQLPQDTPSLHEVIRRAVWGEPIDEHTLYVEPGTPIAGRTGGSVATWWSADQTSFQLIGNAQPSWPTWQTIGDRRRRGTHAAPAEDSAR